MTATHSEQANTSERVNRSILAAIRAYIGSDQQNWDKNIRPIASTLYTKYSPCYLVFGSLMVQHESVYEILRKLKAIAEPYMAVIPTPERRSVVQRKVVENLRQAHEPHEKAYNTRCKLVTFKPGEEVFRRCFAQSNFAKGFNAKHGKQWLQARVIRKRGTAMYELEGLQGGAIPIKMTPRIYVPNRVVADGFCSGGLCEGVAGQGTKSRISFSSGEVAKRARIAADYKLSDKFLKENPDILISKADKGGITIAS